MKPMLARSSDLKRIQSFVDDPKWWFQQKLDGIRILLTVEDGKVTGVGRSGREVALPEEAKTPFVDLEGIWRFDGEFVGTGTGELYLFDMPEAAGIVTPDSSYEDRFLGLTVVYNLLFPKGSEDIKLVPVARTPEEKQELLGWCRVNRKEGVMLKEKGSNYLPGVRSPFMMKTKFTETVDCVILEVGREGKESVAVGAFHNGTITDIGSVKMTDSQGLGVAKVGDVIEVRYLYATPDLRLYQPVFLQFRTDKAADECNTDQLKYTDKTVRPHDARKA